MGAPGPHLQMCCPLYRIPVPPVFFSCHWNKENKQYCGCVCSLIKMVRSLIGTTERLNDLYLITGGTFLTRSCFRVPESYQRTRVLPGLSCWSTRQLVSPGGVEWCVPHILATLLCFLRIWFSSNGDLPWTCWTTTYVVGFCELSPAKQCGASKWRKEGKKLIRNMQRRGQQQNKEGVLNTGR